MISFFSFFSCFKKTVRLCPRGLSSTFQLNLDDSVEVSLSRFYLLLTQIISRFLENWTKLDQNLSRFVNFGVTKFQTSRFCTGSYLAKMTPKSSIFKNARIWRVNDFKNGSRKWPKNGSFLGVIFWPIFGPFFDPFLGHFLGHFLAKKWGHFEHPFFPFLAISWYTHARICNTWI